MRNILLKIIRNLFVSIFLLAFTFTNLYPQWTIQDPLNLTKTYGDVFFINSTEGWARCSNTILHTTDAGNNWNVQVSNTTSGLGDICFIDENYGWINGIGIVLKTTNGGEYWTEKYTGEGTNSICFVDSSNGWASTGHKIIKTTDGGETWSGTDVCPSLIYSIYFSDLNHGWAVGGGDTVLITTNGGLNWLKNSTGLATWHTYYEVFFIDSLTGWIAGDAVNKTTDGGITWESKSSGLFGTLYAIHFPNSNIGWTVGIPTWLETIFKTTNGANSWSGQNCGTSEYLWTVNFPTTTLGWIGGENGTFRNTTNGGSSWSHQKTGNQINSVYFIDRNIGFAVGENGIFITSTDGGSNWNIKKAQSSSNLSHVQFHNQNIGWIAEYGVMRTTDGGLNWIDNGLPAEIINSIFFLDSLEGWAVGCDAAIHKTTDGGITWQNKSSIHVSNTDVFFINSDTGWVCSLNGTILKTTDSGSSWSSLNSFVPLKSITFTDYLHGWSCGNAGNIYCTTNGGTVWAPQVSGVSDNLNSISFADSQNGICVGDDGTILLTTDSGISWVKETGLSEDDLFSVYYYDRTRVWLSGDYGTMLKYSIPQLEIAEPNGGEYLQAGSNFQIEWSSYYIDSLKIDYSTNNGADWMEVINSTPAESFSYTWTVPFHQSADCLVRIRDVYDSSVCDTSDNNFTIHLPEEGWIGQQSGTDKNITSLHFITENEGWACGYKTPGNESIFLRTAKGGDQWDSLTSINNHITSLFFTTLDTGFCVGGGFGEIYKTTDGGSNWSEYQTGPMIWYSDITFVGNDFGIAMGMEGEINRTTNGGNTWSQFYLGYAYDFYDICFTDTNNGWAVGRESFSYSGFIAKTTDGGLNWTYYITNLEGSELLSVDFINSQIGWAGGGRGGTLGMLLKTTDGGNNWSVLFQDSYTNIRSIDFVDENYGWAAGYNGIIIHTTDGGTSWGFQPTGTSNYLGTIQFLNSDVGFASGSNGTILKTENSGLPVELTSFTVSVHEYSVNLTWQTATEINNYGFEIEKQETESRSQNSEWKKIGFVEGHGNSSSPKNYSYIDRNPAGASKFFYKLKQINTDGTFEYSEIIEAEIMPQKYELFQNYPNPFNPITTIKFSIVEPSDVVLNIFNVLGEKVLTEKFTKLEIGFHEYKFDAVKFSSGVYFYSIEIGNRFNDVKKMLLLK